MSWIETIFEETFTGVFGNDATGRLLMGVFGLLIMGAFIVAQRTPPSVSLTANGLLIMLIFGSFFGGIGVYGALAVMVMLAFSAILLFGLKRVVREF